MKNIAIIILFLTAKIGFSQSGQLIGIYNSGSNYLNILSDSTLEFKTTYGCCLLIDIYGFGNYRIVDDIIQVNTIQSENDLHSYYQVINDLNAHDRLDILIEDSSIPIAYCNVVVKEKESKKIIQGTSSDESGLANFENLQINQIDKIIVQISLIGYDTYEIPLAEIIGKSVKVILSPYKVIKNKTVIFNIISDNGSTTIIGPIFPKTKEGRRFERKVKIRMIFSRWPWKWNFKNTHEAKPTEFVKQ